MFELVLKVVGACWLRERSPVGELATKSSMLPLRWPGCPESCCTILRPSVTSNAGRTSLTCPGCSPWGASSTQPGAWRVEGAASKEVVWCAACKLPWVLSQASACALRLSKEDAEAERRCVAVLPALRVLAPWSSSGLARNELDKRALRSNIEAAAVVICCGCAPDLRTKRQVGK